MSIRREVEKRKKKLGGWRYWKSRLSVFLIMSIILTGTKGVSLLGEGKERKNFAENTLEIEGNRIKLHLSVEALRELSEKAIQEGEPLSVTEGELSYSNDPELLARYRAIFSKDREIYELPLSSLVEGLDELPLENAGRIRAFVEANPKMQTASTEKNEDESVLLFSENSTFGKLMAEEKTDWYEKNLQYIQENKKNKPEQETKGTESEENSAESHSESSSKTENKERSSVSSPSEINSGTEEHEEKVIVEAEEEHKTTEAEEEHKTAEVEEETGIEEVHEATTKFTASGSEIPSAAEKPTNQAENAINQTENLNKKAENPDVQSENAGKDYHVSGIETIYFLYENAGEEKLSFRLFVGENSYPTVRIQGRDKEAEKALLGGKEYFSDIRLLKFQKYSLNELGRLSQNKEVEGFGTVEVFYDREAFSERVSLEATLLKKPEDISEEEKGEESGGEKSKEKASSSDILKENEVEALKNRGLYEQSLSLDIRFLNKEGKEVEPSLPVSLRFYIAKKVLPEKVESENIAIHHLVEKEEDGEIAYVETLSEASSTALGEGKATVSVSGSTDTLLAEEVLEEDKERNKEKDENKKEEKKELEKEVKKEVNYNDLEENPENGEKPVEVDQEGYIVRECNAKNFSTYSLTWSKGKDNSRNYKFFFIDGDFRQMGPNIKVDMSKFETERPLFQNKYYNPYGSPYEILYLYHPFTGYTRHIKKKGIYPDNVEGVAIFPSSIALKDMNTETNRNNISWGSPVVYLTTKRVLTQGHYDLGYLDNPTTFWADHGAACNENYYLFYKLNEKPHEHSYTPLDMEMKQEKYITKKSDGSYDLTLTARPIMPEGRKNKLDIIVVYDKSIYMGLDFGRTVGENDEFPYNDAHNNAASKNKFANLIMYSLLDEIAKNPDYDTQFALVTMGGTRNLNVNNAGWFSVTDSAENDAEKVIGFTKDFSVFKQKLDSISIEKEKKKAEYNASAYEHHGLNYAAGIKEAEAFQNGAVVGDGCNKIRQDAKRVVLFLTSYDPNFSYFPQYEGNGNTNYFLRKAEKENQFGQVIGYGDVPGKVEDRLQLGPQRNKPLKYYDYTTDHKAGYSYGSGRGFEEVALTQARGALTELNKIDAFYAIGLGPESNYSHLKDLIGAKQYWATGGHPWEQPLSKDITQEVIKITSNVRDDLVAKKEELRDKIAPPISPLRISKVNIWDQLSENVKVNFDNTNPTDKAAKLRAEVWKVDDNGKPLAKVNNPGAAEGFLGYNGVGARYDPYNEIIKLETKPGDFSFPKGYAFRLTVNVKPTVKAYEKYQKNFMDYFDKEDERKVRVGPNGDIGYLDDVDGSNISGIRQATFGKWKKTGDKGTDQYSLYGETPESEFHTSSEKDGFYSNEGAYLEYERVKANNQRENPGKKLYKKPVVQVEPATLRIVKSFQGTSNSNEELELLKNCSFKLEEEKNAGTGTFTEVKTFQMMQSGNTLGSFVTTELNGGQKQYVLTIGGLIPGRKYRVSEIIPSGKDTVTIAGKTLHFKKIDIIATSSRTMNTGSSGAYVLETLNLSEAETKELKLKNIYETEEKQILRIQKKVSGTWGDRNLLFPFRLKLFKAGGVAINQTDFDSLKANFSAATKSAISFYATDSTIRFSLKDGQGLDFLLPAGYQYQVGEDPKGYLPSVTSGYTLGMTPIDGYRFTAKKVLQKKTGGAKEVLEFENRKDPIPPMGALASSLILPGNLLLFLSLLFLLRYLKKKRKEFIR